ncbi:hypothetical protein [Corynebacterium sp. p3-SID1194]|uniref:hypothetical protein n=1 Tax=Corynebacterium sp. p3-SID1194 TaxID=2916105 RepID=UPI0021A60CA0|nr:hypothetical protein [Corynebacterium sp. p3-SID1194]MCT1450647.1 hypothetical protein [Corynebacterium sp. p3-SID1194]
MASANTKKLRDLGSFDDLIAQRSEAIGADGGTVTIPGFGKDWQVAAPGLQSAEWNDRLNTLQEDVEDELITFSQFRTEFCELMLGDQAEDFTAAADKAGVDPVVLLRWALEKIGEEQAKNPSRRNSPNTRARAKQR